MKRTAQQVGYAGEHFVAAEIHLRGGYAVTFSGNMKGIDLLASDAEHQRKVSIQVKTKSSGTWHANLARDARKSDEDPGDDQFWIFVDIGTYPPAYFIAPAWWVRNDIYDLHQKYLARHGGQRKVSPDSQHHAIQASRIQQWLGRWDLLGIFPLTPLTDPTNVGGHVVDEEGS